MDFTIPEELRLIQMTAKRFIKEELLPLEREVEEKDEFPRDIRHRLKEKAKGLGLWNFGIPIEYGGLGVGTLGVVLVAEELGHVSMAVGFQGGVIGGCRSGGGRGGELKYATDEQKEKYLLPVVRGEKEAYFGLTEPNAGSDVGNLETRAVRDGDNYILNGAKTFSTAVDDSDFGFVYAVTDWEKRRQGGITCFIVDKDAPGFSVGRHIQMMGRHGLHSYELYFDDCVVPAKNILGDLGHGFEIAGSSLDVGRLEGAAACLGTAERALEMAKSYSKQRVTFGQPLSKRQFIQQMVVDSEIDIYASRMMLYNAGWEHEQGVDIRIKSMMVKCFLTEMACRVVDKAIQIHGGYGYTEDLPLEMMYRDVRLYRIVDGPTEVLEWAIARSLLRG